MQIERSPEVTECVELLVSELVTNSYRHSGIPRGSEIRIHVLTTRANVRIEIDDAGSGFHHRERSSRSPLGSGWGLHFVEQLAHRWGIKQNGHTCVWFEIDSAPTSDDNADG